MCTASRYIATQVCYSCQSPLFLPSIRATFGSRGALNSKPRDPGHAGDSPADRRRNFVLLQIVLVSSTWFFSSSDVKVQLLIHAALQLHVHNIELKSVAGTVFENSAFEITRLFANFCEEVSCYRAHPRSVYSGSAPDMAEETDEYVNSLHMTRGEVNILWKLFCVIKAMTPSKNVLKRNQIPIEALDNIISDASGKTQEWVQMFSRAVRVSFRTYSAF